MPPRRKAGRQESNGISVILWGPTEKECGFMWIAVLSALVCFAVATILFTPPLRSYPFYQVLSFYFLFEGAWTLLNAAVDLIWPGSNALVWVHYVGVIVFAGLLFYKIYAYYWKQKHGGGEKKKEDAPPESEK
jgi:hypothetical protein